jgi:hypothetical protein
MTARYFAALALGAGLLAAVGCGEPAPATKAETKKDDDHDDHDHGPGPHGGTIGEFGGKQHFEFTVDHDKKEATVYILKGDAKTQTPIKAEKLSLTVTSPEPKFTVDLVAQDKDAAGKASKFMGKHDGFGKHVEFAGTVSGEVDGKPVAGDFKEEPEKK